MTVMQLRTTNIFPTFLSDDVYVEHAD